MPPLSPWQIVPFPAECLEHMLPGHSTPGDLVDAAVVALAYHRVQAGHLHPILLALLHCIFHQGIVHQAHVQRVGQGNGGLQRAQLLHLQKPRRFAEPVPHKGRSRQLLVE